ncbi:carbohydrate kinase family protein [Terrabacter sp. C0L_2]|uniref:carbohydrate kinase family protein n=1 Tax=Terrabacter sp. C0L_2 TaxID=3108389 RepID=UPI002ED53F41|nr:PfkB family carbohydrate kinase [Terrabacter sp. C0L_2]
MTTRPVVVVGDVGLDVITRPSGDIRWHSDTPSAVALVPGGAGGNSASWLAGLGAEVTLVARVGDDAAGAACRGELEAAGVTCAFAVDPALPTCMVVILLDGHGDRTMFPDRGANKAFSVADVDLASLGLPAEPRPHLHLSGYVLFDAGSRAAGLESLRQARSLGWSTSVDPQSPALIEREGVSSFLGWVDGVDLLLPNENEVAALGGLAAILGHAREVVATYGAAGARWVGADVDESAEAPFVDNVDATGCGDAFNAGLLSAWLGGADRSGALRAGVAAGSAAAARVGARPS